MTTPTEGWEHYPCCLLEDRYETDRGNQRQILEQEADRLFRGGDNIEVWRQRSSNEILTKQTLNWQDLDQTEMLPKLSLFILQQKSSWGYVQSSRETFQKLLTAHSISPVILDCLQSFGTKVTGEDDPLFNICHHQISDSAKNNHYHESCYILRSFERHGRQTLTQKWSLRQMGVYQKYDIRSGNSVWILFQPQQRSREALWKWIPRATHSMSLHAVLLSIGLSGWREYLNDTRKALLQISEKAESSSLTIRDVDYQVSFNDSQRLQAICNKLVLAQTILDNNLDLANAIQKQCDGLEKLKEGQLRADHKLSSSILLETQRIKGFKKTAEALFKQAQGTSQLLMKLLDYRKADALNAHAKGIENLVSASHLQNESLRILAEKTSYDSRLMRILTFIALIYLPATLLAAIFSTDLVQIPRAIDKASSSVLIIQKAMWIYILASIALTLVTLVAITLWLRRLSYTSTAHRLSPLGQLYT